MPAPPDLQPVSIVTTGGITYVQYTWGMVGCDNLLSNGPVVLNGTNFSYNFEIETELYVACPQLAWSLTTTAALGPLAPGDYSLTTTSWGTPVAINNFTVPTNSTPTLQPIGFGKDGSFNIQLNGVNNVDYILQRSTDFVNWTSLSTFLNGQTLTDPYPVLPGPCYYRVQILEPVTFPDL